MPARRTPLRGRDRETREAAASRRAGGMRGCHRPPPPQPPQTGLSVSSLRGCVCDILCALKLTWMARALRIAKPSGRTRAVFLLLHLRTQGRREGARSPRLGNNGSVAAQRARAAAKAVKKTTAVAARTAAMRTAVAAVETKAAAAIQRRRRDRRRQRQRRRRGRQRRRRKQRRLQR